MTALSVPNCGCRILAAAVVLLLSTHVSADSTQDGTTQALLERLGSIQSFRADFVQRVFDLAGQERQRLSGKAMMLRPAFFRWEVKEPYVQVAVLNGDVVSVYEPDLEQVHHQNLGDVADTSVVTVLFSENAEHLEEFDVSTNATGYVLTPKQRQSLITRVVLVFNDNLLEAIDIVDAQDNRTEFAFLDVVVNEPIDRSNFELDIPPGTDVIGSPTSTTRERLEEL